jgi:2-polyprenyl-3-methyl-5-hydroxy-6-metoxy-1,4-benzoquinol methylase
MENTAVKKEKPDIPQLMAEIRERIKKDKDKNKDKLPFFKPKEATSESGGAFKSGHLLRSEDLSYLNHNYQYPYRSRGPAYTSKLPGIFGRLAIKVKSKFIGLREFILRDYIEAEKEFNTRLVRYLNDVSKYVDERDGACFWELVRKIDYDVTKALNRIERISDEQTASIRTAERNFHDELKAALSDIRSSVEDLRTSRSRQQAKISELDSVAHGMEAILNGMSKTPSSTGTSEKTDNYKPDNLDYSYVLLENRYRGSEDEISKRQEIYLPYFKGSSSPVLEIGGGRGEMQSLFKANSIPSYSIDIDEAMVKLNKAKGLDARVGDGISHLSSLQDGSLSGVIALQVLEHLNKNQLENLFKLCGVKLQKGGKVVFETINPKSVLALSSNYFRDLTHVFPLHPETLAFILELSGLKVKEVKMLSPVPEEAKLKSLEIEDYMTPRWAFAIERLNGNIAQLNDLLYGFQDYCIVAEKA